MKKNIKLIEYARYELDENLNIVETDKKFTELTGYTKKDIKNNNLNQMDLIFDEDKEDYMNIITSVVSKYHEAYVEHRIRCKDGSSILVFCLGSLVMENGQQKSVIRIVDMSNSLIMINQSRKIEKKYSNKLKRLVEEATTDGLTGLLRRDAYKYKVNNYLKNEVSAAFIMLDIDNFKTINDSFGHDVGDRILKEVADVFQSVINDDGISCRFGGDEFSIMLLNVNSKKDVINYLEDIREQIKLVKIREDKNYNVTLSMGVKMINERYSKKNFDDIYKECDVLLYKSKGNGKNQYTIK